MYNYKTLYDIIKENSCLTNEGITFIHDYDEEVYVSYEILYNRALDMLYFLQSEGVMSGSNLIIYIEDNELFIYLFWACILGKIIPIPISMGNYNEYKKKLVKVWATVDKPKIACFPKTFDMLCNYISESSDVIAKERYRSFEKSLLNLDNYTFDNRAGNIVEPVETDIALVQFSSGSTGDPKGIILSHQNIITNICAMHKTWEFTKKDITLNWMPLTHDMGLIGVHILSAYSQIQQYIMQSKLFINKPLLWIAKIHQHRVTGIYSPNFGYKYLLSFYSDETDYKWDLSCVRYITNGAEPISVDLCEEFLAAFEKYKLSQTAMKAIYGLGEASASVTLTPIKEKYRYVIVNRMKLNIGEIVVLQKSKTDNDILLADVGKIVEYCEVKICNLKDEVLPEYMLGKILIRGKNVTRGYINDRQREPMEWIDTGDLGFLYEGRLVITGRNKELICINGQNYYPHDIERVAESYEKVKIWRSAACSYFDDGTQTEKIILFIVYKRTVKSFIPIVAELRSYIYKKTGLYIELMIPVKDIPKTTSGKIQRYKLVGNFLNGDYTSELTALMIENENLSVCSEKGSLLWHEEIIIQILHKILQIDSIDRYDDIFELGINSMLLTKLNVEINRCFTSKIMISDLFVQRTVKQIAQYIYNKNRKSNLFSFKIRKLAKYKYNYNQELILHFDNNIYKAISILSSQLNIKMDTVIIGFLLKYMSSLFEMPRFSFQIMPMINRIVFLQVDFNQIDTFSSLLLQIEEQREKEHSIPYHDLLHQRMQKTEQTIIPLFEITEKGAMNLSLSSLFDIVVKYYHSDGCIKLIFVYDNKLSECLISEYADKFYSTIKQFFHNCS